MKELKFQEAMDTAQVLEIPEKSTKAMQGPKPIPKNRFHGLEAHLKCSTVCLATGVVNQTIRHLFAVLLEPFVTIARRTTSQQPK